MRQLTRARPPRSLGALDTLAEQVAVVLNDADTGPLPAVLSVTAADHGVARNEISRFSYGTTSSVFSLITSGDAPINHLAAHVPARVEAADFGLADTVRTREYKVANGTEDLSRRDAMSVEQARASILNGVAFAEERLLQDCSAVGVGEIGVGNTTSAAALTARLLGLSGTSVVGSGVGASPATVERKSRLVEVALQRTVNYPDDPLRLLAALGGFEICGNIGVILGAARAGRIIVLDGFITGVAAVLATRLCPAVAGYLVAAHRSAEPGHQFVLDELELRPLLDLGMRLGMASGAAVALGMINAVLAVCADTPAAAKVGLVTP
ncbi:nicotinate-nucleotide--dimethylbenzimidazole phosphoribosyltransferase [Nocardiopsis sp. HNM0947]|uniref:Nicotinate-nucleotide--dimethylbenzimidazole phosphoribosyltransferase n=1 Tax=Nocardiopsis coralli TaxID=2772213 RepID=A0ABR9P058_9ACTN|nr:nicotinate-nucleotide--dimethylbenzimidazole phosphoribosyltransferase [Nocardiopsis coralli]MBE2997217.1 nicotinate-nucleotide--dimethylbenzimidazole phosphoribosyltransferase [Nocardiopsis coralli]